MKSKTFCVLPWFSRENNTVCCLLPAPYNLEKIRDDLLAGIPSESCRKCWIVEGNGEDSRRIQENRFLDWKLDRDIEKIEEDCRQGNYETLVYQIQCSNLCNQACVTCGSIASTKWQELERQTYGRSIHRLHTVNVGNLNINYKTAQRINFIGGEPMFDPRTFQVLEKLVSANNTECFISFVTNGSVLLNDYQRDLLKKFEHINICFSIDGIEKKFEYLRWPGKWGTLLSNLDSYRNITDNFSISYTISAVNAIYYRETVEWFNRHQLRYNHNIVSSPSWAALLSSPTEIQKTLEKEKFFSTIFNQEQNITTKQELLNQLQQQDAMKKIRLQDYMPELYELLKA